MANFEQWHFVYALNLLLYGFLLYIFIKTKDGKLKIAMVCLFSMLCLSLSSRLILIFFNIDISTINLITIIPSTLGALSSAIIAGSFYFADKK